MSKPLAAVFPGEACLTPSLAIAYSAFDGTWKSDLHKVETPEKPDVLLRQDGMYQCKSCVPPISIRADGADQSASGHPWLDALGVSIVDDRAIHFVGKKAGKIDDKLHGTRRPFVAPEQ